MIARPDGHQDVVDNRSGPPYHAVAVPPAGATAMPVMRPELASPELPTANRRWREVGPGLLITRVVGQGLEFGAFALLARRLGAADFGALSVGFLTCRYAGLVADWGASVRGVRDTAVVSPKLSVRGLVRRRNRVTAVLVPAYIALAVILGKPELSVLAVTLAARGLNRDWLSLGSQRGARAGLPSVLQGAVIVLAAVLVTSLGWAAGALALGYGSGLALSLLLNPLPTEAGDDRASIDGWVLAAVLADQMTASSDTAMLTFLRSARDAGIYAAVYRIPNACVTLIGLTLVGLIPATARTLARDHSRLQALRRRALRVGLLAGGAVLATIPVSYFLVPMLFGPEFAAGQTPLVILLLATAVMAVAAPLHPVYLALGRDRALCAISMTAAAVNLIANILLIRSFGMSGAATATLLAQLVLLAGFWRATRRPNRSVTP